MKSNHVKTLYGAWSEGSLDEQQKLLVADHLTQCPECREYFAKLSSVMQSFDTSVLPQLQPDPFLPTRIAALVKERKGRTPHTAFVTALRVSLAAGAMSLAIVIGVYLGNGSVSQNRQQSSDDYVTTFYDAVSQQSFETSWVAVLDENGRSE